MIKERKLRTHFISIFTGLWKTVFHKQVFREKKAAKPDMPQLLLSVLVGQRIKSRLMINPVDIHAHLYSGFGSSEFPRLSDSSSHCEDINL